MLALLGLWTALAATEITVDNVDRVEVVFTAPALGPAVPRLAYAPGGDRLAIGRSGGVDVWSVSERRLLATLTLRGADPVVLGWRTDDRLVTSWSGGVETLASVDRRRIVDRADDAVPVVAYLPGADTGLHLGPYGLLAVPTLGSPAGRRAVFPWMAEAQGYVSVYEHGIELAVTNRRADQWVFGLDGALLAHDAGLGPGFSWVDGGGRVNRLFVDRTWDTLRTGWLTGTYGPERTSLVLAGPDEPRVVADDVVNLEVSGVAPVSDALLLLSTNQGVWAVDLADGTVRARLPLPEPVGGWPLDVEAYSWMERLLDGVVSAPDRTSWATSYGGRVQVWALPEGR